MGGTLVPRGGHNILEPAVASRAIVFGPHMENFREIASVFLKAGAAIQVQSPDELAIAIGRLLNDAAATASLGEKARRIIGLNAGATARFMSYLVASN